MLVVDLAAEHERVARAHMRARLHRIPERVGPDVVPDDRIDRPQVLADRTIVLRVHRKGGAQPVEATDVEALVPRVEKLQPLRGEGGLHPSEAAPQILVAAYVVLIAPLIPAGQCLSLAQARRCFAVDARLREAGLHLTAAEETLDLAVVQAEEPAQDVMRVAAVPRPQIAEASP